MTWPTEWIATIAARVLREETFARVMAPAAMLLIVAAASLYVQRGPAVHGARPA